MKGHVLSRCVVGAIAGLTLLFLPHAALANCQNGSTTQAVSAGQNLTQIIESSDAPCTLSVGPGTYDATPTALTGDSIFRISSGITVRSVSGATLTTLRVPAGTQWAAVNIQPLNGRCPSNATLDGFTLTGGVWGAYAGWANQPGCPANVISNLTLRNLIINTSYYGPPGGHGIDFIGVHNSVIDSCTVNSAGANGIFLESDNQNNLVMNNTIQSTGHSARDRHPGRHQQRDRGQYDQRLGIRRNTPELIEWPQPVGTRQFQQQDRAQHHQRS